MANNDTPVDHKAERDLRPNARPVDYAAVEFALNAHGIPAFAESLFISEDWDDPWLPKGRTEGVQIILDWEGAEKLRDLLKRALDYELALDFRGSDVDWQKVATAVIRFGQGGPGRVDADVTVPLFRAARWALGRTAEELEAKRPVPKPGGAIGRTFDQFLQDEKWKEIVRELADIPPLAYDMGWYCLLCNGGGSWDYDTSVDPAHHNPACPWRRAVELVEGEG